MEHVRELRGRLVWVALWFVLVTGAAFPFFEDIIKLLMKPLGNEKLYYLTPIGGVSFAIKVCMVCRDGCNNPRPCISLVSVYLAGNEAS